MHPLCLAQTASHCCLKSPGRLRCCDRLDLGPREVRPAPVSYSSDKATFRIHDTIDLDSELIQTLIEEKQERLEQKKSKFNKMGEWMQTLLGKLVNNMPMTQGDWRDVVQGGDFEKYFYGNTTLEPSLQELESEKTPIS
jgi:hypothetical protein